MDLSSSWRMSSFAESKEIKWRWAFKRGPEAENCHPLSMFPGVNYKTLLILEVLAFNGQGGGGLNLKNLYYHLFILLANDRILYFGHFQGVMKIRFAVTLAVLRLLFEIGTWAKINFPSCVRGCRNAILTFWECFIIKWNQIAHQMIIYSLSGE